MISINPPPSDRRCECCNRHVDEVPEFGGPGDPLVGDFKGAKLLKNFRNMYPRDSPEYEEYMQAWRKGASVCGEDNYEAIHDYLVKEYGAEKAEAWDILDQLANTVEASWECRDCFILEGTKFFKKREESYKHID